MSNYQPVKTLNTQAIEFNLSRFLIINYQLVFKLLGSKHFTCSVYIFNSYQNQLKYVCFLKKTATQKYFFSAILNLCLGYY